MKRRLKKGGEPLRSDESQIVLEEKALFITWLPQHKQKYSLRSCTLGIPSGSVSTLWPTNSETEQVTNLFVMRVSIPFRIWVQRGVSTSLQSLLPMNMISQLLQFPAEYCRAALFRFKGCTSASEEISLWAYSAKAPSEIWMRTRPSSLPDTGCYST